MLKSVQSPSGHNRVTGRVCVFVELHGRCSQVVAIFMELTTFLRWFLDKDKRDVLNDKFRGFTWQRSGNPYTLNPKP